MPIPGVCPSCGAKFDLPQALTDAEARQALAAALEFPAPLARMVVHYIALFAPAGKAVTMGKLARLLRQLTEQVGSVSVTRNRITHAAPQELWRQGIEEVLAARDAGSLILPLKDHAYLSEVVWRLAAKAAARGEQQREAQRPLHPSHRDPERERRRELAGDLAALERLQANAPNDALAEKIASLKEQLNGR